MNLYEEYPSELYHFGIKGMKWGVRRYQNKDGSLTAAGRKRLDKNEAYRQKLVSKAQKNADRDKNRAYEADYNVKDLKRRGVNSQAYRDWKNREYNKREFEYEWENDDKRYRSSGTRLLDEVIDGIGSKTKVQDLIDENYANSRMYRASAKNWMDNKSNLMNMKVTALTKKKDIKRVYKG